MTSATARTVATRAVSTVLDAAVCLLLVTASAATLAGVPAAHDERATGQRVGPVSADETADLLATSTARVTYSVGDPARTGARTRTAHDTLAGLLASAARADAEAESGSSDAPNATFVVAVVDRVERALRRVDHRVQVVAGWPAASERPADDDLTTSERPAASERPADDDPADGRVVVGETPLRTADVHSAELVVRGVRFTVRTWSA